MMTPISLLCISQWILGITICLTFKLKYGQGDSIVKKDTLANINRRMLIYGCLVLGKTRQTVASKSQILFFGPKQHKLNASGSKLYMNLKKNYFCICQKKKKLFLPQHYYPIRCSHCQKNVSEQKQFFIYGLGLYVYIIGSRFPKYFFSATILSIKETLSVSIGTPFGQ